MCSERGVFLNTSRGKGNWEGRGGPKEDFYNRACPVVQFRYKFKTFISTFNPEACSQGGGGGGASKCPNYQVMVPKYNTHLLQFYYLTKLQFIYIEWVIDPYDSQNGFRRATANPVDDL